MGIKVNFAKPGEIEYNVTTRDDRKFVLRYSFRDLLVTYVGVAKYKHLVGKDICVAIDVLLRDGCAYKSTILGGSETRLI